MISLNETYNKRGRNSVKDGAPLGRPGNVLAVDFGGAGGAGRLIELKSCTKYRFSVWGKNSAAANTASDAGIKYNSADNPGYQHHETLSFTENEWTHKSVAFTTLKAFATASSAFIWKIDANTIFILPIWNWLK